MQMRKLAMLPAAIAVAAVVAAPAASADMADDVEMKFTSKASISPKKAGTKKNPRGVRLKGDLKVETITQGVEKPIVTGGEVLIPKGGLWNGGKYAKCAGAKMDKAKTADVCPKKSIMGAGKGVAWADNVNAAPTVEFVNGGANRLWAFTTLYRPALVQKSIAINIKKTKGKWAYRTSFKVPQVLQVVAGVPVTLASFNFNIGGKPYAKDLLATTSCPKSKKHAYQATAFYKFADDSTRAQSWTGSVACTR